MTTRPKDLPLRERLLRAGVLLPAPREPEPAQDQVRGGPLVAK